MAQNGTPTIEDIKKTNRTANELGARGTRAKHSNAARNLAELHR